MESMDKQIAKMIEDKLLSIRTDDESDLFNERGRDELLKQVQHFVNQNTKIQLLLPAFPCKSSNLDKVTGKLPDAGEVFALKFLNGVCEEIGSIYEPGCELMIWSDGRVFGDLIEVPDEDISRYERLLRYHTSNMKHLHWDNMNNYVNTRNGETLVAKFGTPTFSFQEWHKTSENNRQTYQHMRKFMENDLRNAPASKTLSRRLLRAKIAKIAEEMIVRNDALTNILKIHYPHHIRLSIHQHVNSGEKFTIKFFKNPVDQDGECQSFLRTPWHNVLVIDLNGNFNMIPYKKLNLESEHVPIMFEDQIWCFVQLPKDCPAHSALRLSMDGHLVVDTNEENGAWKNMLMNKFCNGEYGECQTA